MRVTTYELIGEFLEIREEEVEDRGKTLKQYEMHRIVPAGAPASADGTEARPLNSEGRREMCPGDRADFWEEIDMRTMEQENKRMTIILINIICAAGVGAILVLRFGVPFKILIVGACAIAVALAGLLLLVVRP